MLESANSEGRLRGRWDGGAVSAGGGRDCSREDRDRMLPVKGDKIDRTVDSSRSEGSVEGSSTHSYGGDHKNVVAEVYESGGESVFVQADLPSETVSIRIRTCHQP